MKLYYHPYSQPSRTAVAVARHLGIDLDLELLRLDKGEHKTPEFLAINPCGKVPALVDGEVTVWESSAIFEYLIAQAGDQMLLPEDPAARAQVNQWRYWAMTTWNRPLALMTFHRMFAPLFGKEPNQALLAEGEKLWREAAGLLEAHLAGREWVAGTNLSLADFTLASMLTHWEAAEVPLGDFPAVRAWYARVEALPAWEETVPRREQ